MAKKDSLLGSIIKGTVDLTANTTTICLGDCVDLYVHYSSWDSKKENQVMRQLFSDGGSYMMYPESGELWVAQKYDPNVQEYWSLMTRP